MSALPGLLPEALAAHLASGHTTLARCWSLTRRDGAVLGFTDHDRDLSFGGVTFSAGTGLTARALQQTTGLSIDNTEALGGLSSEAVEEADILAGRYDGAAVEAWLVNWQDIEQRVMQFRGTLGEVTRGAGGFRAELIGLAEALNRDQGRVFQPACTAVLGDGQCRADLGVPGYRAERAVEGVEEGQVFTFAAFTGYDDRWFERGRLTVLSGPAAGLTALIKNDRLDAGGRVIETWEALRAPLAAGDMLRLEAGCDKALATCRFKFDNILNFRGFPTIPGEDWLMAVPGGRGTTRAGAATEPEALPGADVTEGWG